MVLRFSVVLAFAAVLLAPPAAHAEIARFLGGSGEALALTNGRGQAVVTSRDGAIIGTIGRGRIAIVDFPRGAETEIELSGCETRRRPSPNVRICIGREIIFSVVKGRWLVRMRGMAINASAVLEGAVSLVGRRGTYEIDDGDERRWPRELRTFRLA